MKVQEAQLDVVVRTNNKISTFKGQTPHIVNGKVVKIMPRAKMVVLEFIHGQIATGRITCRVPFDTEVDVVEGAKEYFWSFGTYKY